MGEPVSIKRKDVYRAVSDEVFQQALSAYNYTKLWGMPNANGWANEPVELLDAITAIELEARAMEHEELENMRNGTAKTSSKSVGSMRNAKKNNP